MTRTTSSQRWVLAVAGTASFMVALDALVVSTALSTIRTDLHASLAQLEWTVNAYVLSFAVLMMTASALGDRVGRRRIFNAGLSLFAAASAGCALAPDATWLVLARAVQGAGAAMVMPLALALLGAAFGPERRGWAMGIFSSLVGFSMLCGPLVGGAVVQSISWPWIFWLNVPIALALIVAARARVEEGFGQRAPLDVRGLVLVTAAGLGVVWGLVRGNSVGWGSLEVVLALALGALLTVAFVACELRAREPMLPLALFASRGFSAGNAAMFFWQASVMGTLFFMAQFLQTGLGYGPLGTGLRLMPWGATTFVVPQIAARLSARVGERRVIVGGLALHAAAMAWIAAMAAPGLAYWHLVAPLLLSGAGFALAAPAIQSVVLGSVAPRHIGKASGTLSTVRQLGAVFGVSILAAVFAAAGGYASAQAFCHGFVAAIAASGVLAVLGALAGLSLAGARRPSGRRARAAALRTLLASRS
jgi:EmrB/QacA subfamily drug resistance transporter